MTSSPLDALSEESRLPAATRGASTRRAFFTAGLAGAAAIAAARPAAAQDPVGQDGHQPVPSDPFDPILFLVNRITQGFSLAEYRRARDLGYDAYLEEQLNPQAIDDSALEALLAANFPTLAKTMQELVDDFPPGGPDDQLPASEARAEFLFRSVYSKRQLQERMVEFWTDHFNTYQQDGPVRYFKAGVDGEQAAVIRANALGNFWTLLDADAHSAAMLHYLDNYANVVGTAQENYARELLELHTVGEGNFTENDVAEVAKCFTGWRYWGPVSGIYGQFRYVDADHDQTEKTVLGTTIPANGGESDANLVLGLLQDNQDTANFIAGKLARWLLNDQPPARAVRNAARAYMVTNGNIRAMIRQILRLDVVAEVLANSKKDLRRFKRPYHMVAGMLRALGADVTSDRLVRAILDLLGQVPFQWPAPNGYPDSKGFWGSNFLGRANAAYQFATGGVLGVSYDVGALFAQLPGGLNPSKVGRQINRLVAGGGLSKLDENEVQKFYEAAPFQDENILRQAIAVAMGSPSYQYY